MKPEPPVTDGRHARRARALERRMHAIAVITVLLSAATVWIVLAAGPGRIGPDAQDLTRADAMPFWGGAALAAWAIAALLCLGRPREPALAGVTIAVAAGLSAMSGLGAPVEAPVLPGLPSRLELALRVAGPAQAEALLARDAGARAPADQAYLAAQLAAARGDTAAVRRLLDPWRLRLDRLLYGLVEPKGAPGAPPTEDPGCCAAWRPDVLAALETLAYGRPLSAAALDATPDRPSQVDPTSDRGPRASAAGFVLSLILALGAWRTARLWQIMRGHLGRIRSLLQTLRPRVG